MPPNTSGVEDHHDQDVIKLIMVVKEVATTWSLSSSKAGQPPILPIFGP